ncbi:hypothetical protein, partial [Treponema sp. R8-4-B8]
SKKRREGRIFDYYFAPKYQNTLGVSYGGLNLEGGLIWGDGMFLGVDFGIDGKEQKESVGIGLSLGNVYDLRDALQLVYGGSVGSWWGHYYGDYKYKGYSADREDNNYLALFVKLRWKLSLIHI